VVSDFTLVWKSGFPTIFSRYALVSASTHVFTRHFRDATTSGTRSISSYQYPRFLSYQVRNMTTQALIPSLGATAPPFYISKSANAQGKSIGNGVFAGHGFKAGEEITSLERPLVGSLDSQYLQDTCSNCYVWTEGASTGTRLYVPENIKVQKCAGCQMPRYCSKVRFLVSSTSDNT
jgi:hypothetical protein